MGKLFERIGRIIEERPFKVLFATILIFVIMITGAVKVNMATGNETLVKKDSDAYISNYTMEEDFGGDAIMVLFEGEQKDLLRQDNMEKMWNVEQRLKYNDDIFSFMSPASIVYQITDKQASEIKGRIPDISDGLGTMSERITEIGNELGDKKVPDPEEMEDKLNSIMAKMDPDTMMDEMMEDQKAQLEDKMLPMSRSLGEMGRRLTDIGKELGNKDLPDPNAIEDKLDSLTGMMGPNNPVFKEIEEDSKEMQENISNMGQGLGQMGSELTAKAKELEDKVSEMQEGILGSMPEGGLEDLEQMPAMLAQLGENLTNISNQLSNADSMMPDTSTILDGLQSQMNQEIAEMKEGLSGGLSPDELGQMSGGFLTMGDNLSQLSSGIADMVLGGEMLPDASDDLSGLTNTMEETIEDMKANLADGMSPEDLETMFEGFITMGENLQDLSEGLETFHEKSGMMIPNFPHNQKELDNILYEDDGSLRDVFEDTILDDNHHMIMIKLNGNLEDDVKDDIYAEVDEALVKEEFEDIDYIVSGKPVLDSSLREEMKSNMMYMVAFAVVIMFIILNLVFKVRWRILSLGVIFVSVIGTLGLMGHLGVSMTMVSMAVFPILIGLGIDYSIQIQNRYEEEKSAKTTLSQIGIAVGIAVLATVLGFISLYASPVPMIQDFGKMLTIGVIISFIGSIFLLTPILTSRDIVDNKLTNLEKDLEEKESFMDRLLGGTANFVTKYSVLVITIAIVLAVFGLIADQSVGVETDIETFMPQDMDALEDIRYVRDIVGSTDQMVLYMEDDNILSQSNIEWIQDITEDIEDNYSEEVTDIKSIDSVVSNFSDDEDLGFSEYKDVIEEIPEGQRKMFLSEDKNKAVILMNIKHMPIEKLQDFVKDINKELEDAPVDVSVTGKSVLDVEMVKGLTEGRVKMTIIGIGLVFLALLIVYRSFFKALIPVFPIILIVGMSGGIMKLLGLKYTPITATLGALVLGMGTEMTIMLLERYLEERNSGRDKRNAMSITMKRIGAATVASGLTTVGGFSVLMLSKFVILKDFGLMTVINISLALMSTFVILPAILWVLDRFIVDKNIKSSL